MKRFLIATALAAVAMGSFGCSSSKEVATASAAPASPTAAPAASPAEDSTILASGPAVVENQIDVQAQREGIVASLSAEPGAQVKSGQLLARLDDRQITSDLEAASARVRSIEANLKNWEAESKVLQADFDRAQKMWDAQLITKEALDHAKYKMEADQYEIQRERESLNNARAVQHSLELEREKTFIRAPFGGIVARRYVRIGQRVTAGDRLFWLSALAPLRVRFTLPEKFLGRIKNGQRLVVTAADAAPEQKHSARVIQVSPVVDPASGTIEVLAEVVGDPKDLRPGMMTNVRLENQP